jgi:hypothetical protein
MFPFWILSSGSRSTSKVESQKSNEDRLRDKFEKVFKDPKLDDPKEYLTEVCRTLSDIGIKINGARVHIKYPYAVLLLDKEPKKEHSWMYMGIDCFFYKRYFYRSWSWKNMSFVKGHNALILIIVDKGTPMYNDFYLGNSEEIKF